TQAIVENNISTNNKIRLVNLTGKGVGFAIDTGHQEMLKLLEKPFVSVVMAGDGQMDSEDLPGLIEPIINNQSDYVKGNRFHHKDGVTEMPKLRKLASILLGFLTTLAAGRHFTDPQCGYTATSHNVLEEWNWSKSWRNYGYPNYWLIELSRKSLRVKEIPVKCVYGDEKSGLKMFSFFISVGLMMLIMHHKRCFAMLFSKSVAPHTILSFTAYAIGWIAILPEISTDLERELTNSFISKIVLALFCWICAHIFDRLAVKSRTELRINAQT
ncbi:MAG: glycosyltransferase family 2 protein, partial [Candidatus Thermoplasmatota archaeon]|nr:glycosyltransferase family 2 protein [Candidatus Thermoplasmatota archaeon]